MKAFSPSIELKLKLPGRNKKKEKEKGQKLTRNISTRLAFQHFSNVESLFPSCSNTLPLPPPLEQILEQMVRKRKAKINRRYNSASGKCQNVVARRPNRDVNRSVDLTDEVSGSIPRAIYTHHPTSCLYKVAVVSRMRKSCSLTGSRLLAPRDARSIVNRPVRHRLPG